MTDARGASVLAPAPGLDPVVHRPGPGPLRPHEQLEPLPCSGTTADGRAYFTSSSFVVPVPAAVLSRAR